ncbi:MAG: PspC domain-containing protein [Bacteroidia bacterium]
MNKTLTVNIGGMVFHIEEQAYEKLRKYLDTIRGYFTSSDGRDEIIQDVEARIAEMFNERIKGDSKQVIIDEDVEHVINVMGRPEQFAGDDAAAQETYAANISEKRTYRKIYRDVDDKVISGVCAGLSHRLEIDPLWMRLIWVVMFFILGGIGGIILYIVLALVLPKAETTAQKLEMKGEHVTVSSIRKSVEDPVEKKSSGISRFFDGLGRIIRGILKIFLYIIGAFFAVIGLIVLFALCVALLAVMGVAGISIPVFISDLFLTPGQQFWSMLAIFLIIGIPVIMLIYGGIKLLFGIKHKNRVFNITVVSLMILGWIIGFCMVADIGREFATESKQRTVLPLVSPSTDTLFVDVMRDAKYEDEDDNRNNIGFMFGHRMTVVTGDELRMAPENVNLDIQKADGSQFELVQIKSSRGATEKIAAENANKINYNFEQKDSLLSFSRYFPLPNGVKYRDQKVKLILKVPVGKSVYLSENSDWIIYDVDNVTNTWDGDMVGKTWTMTEQGLECMGCNLSGSRIIGGHRNIDDDSDWTGGDAHIKIDKHGVHINADGRKDSINFHGKDVDIKIDENGVVIDANKK